MSNPGPAVAQTANSFSVINAMQLLFILRGANFQITQDQQFNKIFTGTTLDPQYITANWISGAYATSCLGGIFTLPGKGGSAIVSVGQSYSGLTGANTHVNATIQASTTTFTTTPFLSLSTANGGILTADVFIYGFCYD